MRFQILLVFIILSFVSCSTEDDEGFFGKWEGTASIIVNGNPTTSATSAVIAEIDSMIIECNVIANGTSYIFDTREVGGKLTFSNAPAKNLEGLSTQTRLTGTAELIADTLLVFQHQVVTMSGSSIISAVNYDLEFTREE